MIRFSGDLRRDFDKATAEISNLKDRILGRKRCHHQGTSEPACPCRGLLDHDGTNTGTPTAQTPANKNKVIPNSRRSTGKPKGGQAGHKKASLQEPGEDDVTDTVEHSLQDDECCPKCGLVDCTPTGESEILSWLKTAVNSNISVPVFAK